MLKKELITTKSPRKMKPPDSNMQEKCFNESQTSYNSSSRRKKAHPMCLPFNDLNESDHSNVFMLTEGVLKKENTFIYKEPSESLSTKTKTKKSENVHSKPRSSMAAQRTLSTNDTKNQENGGEINLVSKTALRGPNNPETSGTDQEGPQDELEDCSLKFQTFQNTSNQDPFQDLKSRNLDLERSPSNTSFIRKEKAYFKFILEEFKHCHQQHCLNNSLKKIRPRLPTTAKRIQLLKETSRQPSTFVGKAKQFKAPDYNFKTEDQSRRQNGGPFAQILSESKTDPSKNMPTQRTSNPKAQKRRTSNFSS